MVEDFLELEHLQGIELHLVGRWAAVGRRPDRVYLN
jgi:hypothetical protein